ncbi:MAG: GIY-YIG nuclease family protein [Alphaproteobacteria bacterium]|nr:GIY-YIG nuclease family protein [Alphaproteobacteria bacterium]
MKRAYIYILASQRNGTLYVGITNNIIRRIFEHKNGSIDGFTKKYKVTRLVYYEVYDDLQAAIAREKELKGWLRKRKIELIEQQNPNWIDLYEDLVKAF